MPRFLLLGKVLLLGFSAAQGMSTLQVRFSNIDYYALLTAVQEAGYLAVPTETVYSTLRDIGPAFRGGLFFTLTAGLCLTLVSAALAWLWDRLLARDRILFLLWFLLLVLSLLSANRRGFSPLISGYLLAIPTLVFPFTLKWLPAKPRRQRPAVSLFPLLGFSLLAVLLFAWRPSVLSKDRLLDIRDALLLSNAWGRRANAFYYENSLYATRVFRSPRHELLKSCAIEGLSDSLLRTRIAEALLSRDYLPLENTARTDVRIVASGEHLRFYAGDKRVLESSTEAFLRNPALTLREIEERTHRHRFLLGFTLFSTLFVGTVLLCAGFYVPFYWLSGLLLKSTPRAVKAGVLGPVALLAAFFAFSTAGRERAFDTAHLSGLLASDHLPSRIAALKFVLTEKIDIAGFPAYAKMAESPSVPERYWLARALGVSGTPETRRTLHRLLRDPHFNVICMALDSLGRRGNRSDIRPVLDKIMTSDNGYEQWYGYRALRRLGWRQKKAEERLRMGAIEGSHALVGNQFGQ
jgi:hypothetical protein